MCDGASDRASPWWLAPPKAIIFQFSFCQPKGKPFVLQRANRKHTQSVLFHTLLLSFGQTFAIYPYQIKAADRIRQKKSETFFAEFMKHPKRDTTHFQSVCVCCLPLVEAYVFRDIRYVFEATKEIYVV